MHKRGLKDISLNMFRGMAMGMADLVPGVSGGTVAFITGIYMRLLDAIRGVFDILSSGEILTIISGKGKARREVLGKIDFALIIPLLTGILLSVFILSGAIIYLVEEHAVATYSFFIGLVLASTVMLSRDVDMFRDGRVFILASGFLFGFTLAGVPAIFGFSGWTILFISGAIAITAMILPGVSGSLMILMMGQYERMLQAVNQMDIVSIMIFILGCIIGLWAFSSTLSRLMKEHPGKTKTFLIGLMLGSLRYQGNIISDNFIGAMTASKVMIFITLGIISIICLDILARKGAS